MLKPFLFVMAMLAASPALAQDRALPTLFDVTGVAANDVLNIRQTPSASAAVTGRLAPDQTRIEVVGLDASGRWGQVNTGEQAGWVSMRFLAPRANVWKAGQLPEGLICSGTEPFWSFSASDGTLNWQEPGHETRLSGLSVMDSGIGGDRRRGLFVEDAHDILTASITPAACSDGMSDMAYGLAVTVIRQSRDGAPRMNTGCCRIR
ncbi:MAG: SH3 domain-containing protein [Paracoccus sp. (in: a-proteobacteria)]|nr:SH3 domain-containing protein [Paracoccus sp. (in: a-proteobacteria)]